MEKRKQIFVHCDSVGLHEYQGDGGEQGAVPSLGWDEPTVSPPSTTGASGDSDGWPRGGAVTPRGPAARPPGPDSGSGAWMDGGRKGWREEGWREKRRREKERREGGSSALQVPEFYGCAATAECPLNLLRS